LFSVSVYDTLILPPQGGKALYIRQAVWSLTSERRWEDADYFDVSLVWTHVHTADQKVKPPPLQQVTVSEKKS